MKALIVFLTALTLNATAAKVGESAPDFQLKDSNGKVHRLADYTKQNKIVVLEWFNKDCPYVKKHYLKSKNMQDLQEKWTGKGVVWLSIISSAAGKQGHMSAKEINDMRKKWNVNSTATLIDEGSKVASLYEAKTTPHMYIVQAGKLVYNGAIDDNDSASEAVIPKSKNYVDANLTSLMGDKKAVEVATTTPYGCSVKY